MSGAAAPDAAKRRLVDAQVLMALKNYDSAAIVLVDVIEKYPQAAAYPDAIWTLADALSHKRDYLSARHYLEKLVEVGPQVKHYLQALERLVELSLYTGDYSPVEGYF